MSIGRLISELIDTKIEGPPKDDRPAPQYKFELGKYFELIAEIEADIDAAISASQGGGEES